MHEQSTLKDHQGGSDERHSSVEFHFLTANPFPLTVIFETQRTLSVPYSSWDIDRTAIHYAVRQRFPMMKLCYNRKPSSDPRQMFSSHG